MKAAMEATREHGSKPPGDASAMPGQDDDAAADRTGACWKGGRKLRVAHLSPSYGGVANAAKQLHAGLLEIGVESRFLSFHAPRQDENLKHVYALPLLHRGLEYADCVSRWIERKIGLDTLIHGTPDAQSMSVLIGAIVKKIRRRMQCA
jgi:hypothetical protein